MSETPEQKRIRLLDELAVLDSSPTAPPSSAPPSAGGGAPPDDEEYGIPEELRIKRRPYTMSEAALAQRRAATSSPAKGEAMKGNQNAWKTGEHARGFIRQIFKPCKSTCTQYPCSLVEDGATSPGEACLDKQEFMHCLANMQSAIKSGKADDIKDMAALRIAGVWEVVRMLTEDILTDNTVVKSQKIDKEGNVIGFEIKPHPSLLSLGKLVESAGLTAPEWMVTPRQIAKEDTDKKTSETLATLMGKVARVSANSKDEADKE